MRRHARGIVIGLAVAAVTAGLALAPLLLTHRSDLPFERAYGNAVVSLVSRVMAGGATNPVVGSTRAATNGRAAYVGSCAVCHGATGDGKGAFGQTTYPAATDLLGEDAKALSDAQLYWITKNGLSFTAMPGFGTQYSDQDLWSIVSYIRQLQQGRASTIDVPAATAAQLAVADPLSPNAAARGAAVYFAQGCAYCHGAVGNAPGELALRGAETEAIRRGRAGMPAYGTSAITAAQLSDLVAYVRTFGGGRGGRD
ncbi:MAG TPA: c-type cytochrome [Candidatus Limnocylindria bacterium]|nr:c-type cytochrome [Candidatus Limnocylindria bacterium]